jgi:hypothetical protein
MKTILRIMLITVILGYFASVPVAADTAPMPMCYPNPCPVQ